MSSEMETRVKADADLVRRAKGGDLDAFEALTSQYERQVYTIAMRILNHAQDAQDVTQETFLSALEHIGGFREEARFSTWLSRIATNAALKIIRKRKSLPAVSLDADPENDSVPRPEFIADWRQSPEELVQSNEIRALLETELAQLDEKYRLVFLLRDVEGLSVAETSAALGISEVNVKVRLLRARLQLREKLTRALGDPQKRVKRGTHNHHADL